MFGANSLKSTLSLGNVLSGISKGLNIVNQAIPIYKEVKPMIGNARKVMGILKEFSKDSVKVSDVKTNKKEVTKITKSITSSTNPTFFQ